MGPKKYTCVNIVTLEGPRKYNLYMEKSVQYYKTVTKRVTITLLEETGLDISSKSILVRLSHEHVLLFLVLAKPSI